MNIQNLRYLLEIAQRGSVTAAAKVLYLSQPRLSKILAETERKYGVAIFKRENNGLTPTEAGQKFLKIARDIVEEAEGKRNCCIWWTRPTAPEYLQPFSPLPATCFWSM